MKARRQPQNRRRERTREAILDAARALLLANGHEKLSLREIAERADYSAPAIYEYFENKQALISALAERASGSLAEGLRRAAELGSASEDGALVEMGRAYVAFASEHQEEFLLLSSRQGSSCLVQGNPIPAGSPYRALFEEVAREVVSGSLSSRTGQAEQIAYGLWSLAHGMAMLQLTNLAGFDADFTAADRNALRAYVAGLCP